MSTLWTPAQIDTALWLDAADTSTLTLVSGAVSEWRDKSGNTRHFSEGSSSNRPTVAAFELDGKDVIRFNGSSNRLRGTPWFSLGSVCAYMVLRYRSLGIAGLALSARNADPETAITRFYFQGDSTDFVMTVGSDPRSAIKTPANTNWNTQSQSALSGTHKAFLNAALIGSAANGDTGAPGRLALGALESSDGATFTNYASVDCAEIVFMDSDAHEDEINGYLAHKWGLEANLPADHPYKLAAPVAVGISGTVTDDAGQPTSRTVRVYNRATGTLLGTATSDAVTGAYSFTLSSSDMVQVVALDDDAGIDYNALIVDRVMPE